MVENTNQYLEKTEIEGFGGNLFLYKRLENANADSKDIWHYRAKIVGMKGYVRRSTKETNFELQNVRLNKITLIIRTNLKTN